MYGASAVVNVATKREHRLAGELNGQLTGNNKQTKMTYN